MGVKVLELGSLRNNVHSQCVPIGLFVVLQNQFLKDKRTNISKISYKKIKTWVDYGSKHHKVKAQLTSGKEKKYFDELYHGNYNQETFHQELNTNIRDFNLRLVMKAGITSEEIKKRIDEDIYPMLLIAPHYINEARYKNHAKKTIRGEPQDQTHLIVVHGYDDKHFMIYDCDLKHENEESLSEENIRCRCSFPILKNYSKSVNRLYWFELIDKTRGTSLSQY